MNVIKHLWHRMGMHKPQTSVRLRSGVKLWCAQCKELTTKKLSRIDRQGWFNIALATYTIGLSLFIGPQFAFLMGLLLIFAWLMGRAYSR